MCTTAIAKPHPVDTKIKHLNKKTKKPVMPSLPSMCNLCFSLMHM